VIVHFVEHSAKAFGLAHPEAMKLCLAVEEIFVYLSRFVCSGKLIEVQCWNGLFYARVDMRFRATELNLGGLNLTARMLWDEDAEIREMGLMIASRTVDRLEISSEKHDRIRLRLLKEKAYPKGEVTLPVLESTEIASVEDPDVEKAKRFAVLVRQTSEETQRPLLFDYPGKVSDMLASGEYQCLLALGKDNQVLGGILFTHRTKKIVWCCGPYVFALNNVAVIGETLLDACIGRIARTNALGIHCLYGLPVFLSPWFESVGTLKFFSEREPPVYQASFFRHLHEDPGCRVWSHPQLGDYLSAEYQRLVLARDIQIIENLGERRSGASVFAAEVNRERAEVTLRPLWPAADLEDNVERHVRFLIDDHFLNIFFEIDLGIPWHAEIIPALLANGFHPGMLLPFAGQSDLVIFQYYATES
jgi:hypothetical protein